MANGRKPRMETRSSLKFLGTCRETTRRVSARPKITSLKTSRRDIAVPRRRNPLSVRCSVCERDIAKTPRLPDGNFSRPRLFRWTAFQIQNGGNKFTQGHAHVTPQALFQARVILRAAEDVRHQLTEDGAAAKELDHASGDGSSEKRSAIKAANDAGGKFKFRGEGRADPIGINFGFALCERFAQQFAGAHCVEQPFASQWIDPRGGIADECPIFADNGTLRKGALLRGRQDVRIKLRAIERDFLFLNELLKVFAQFAAGVGSHVAANPHG